MICFVITRFLMISASHGPCAIAEVLVLVYHDGSHSSSVICAYLQNLVVIATVVLIIQKV